MTDEAGKYRYKPLSLNANNTVGYLKEVALVVNQLFKGKIQCTGQFTLPTGTTSTVIYNPNCSEFSVVLLSPLTSNALSEHGNTYVSAYTDGQFTITHHSFMHTDVTFRYVLMG